MFRGEEDQSIAPNNDQATLATNVVDQSSLAGTFVTLGEDGDDGSTIQSFSRLASLSDTSTFEESISDVSSNSIGGTFESEIEDEELEMQAQAQLPSKFKLSPKRVDANIVKDWSREGLSKSTIGDMDLFMDAMRS